jgi:hypothetical protein
MLTSPFFVYSLTPNNSPREWSIVFVIHALLLLLGNAVFCFVGSGTPALFTGSVTDRDYQQDPDKEDPSTRPIIDNTARKDDNMTR